MKWLYRAYDHYYYYTLLLWSNPLLLLCCHCLVSNQFSLTIFSFIASADFNRTWSGQLPPRQHRNPTYSTRIFVGGVPRDITEAELIKAFRPFGNLSIEWPDKEGKHCSHPPKGEYKSCSFHEHINKYIIHGHPWHN